VFLRVAELGLVLLLFTDASRTDLRVLRNIGTLPGGLLSAGTLLTILPGTLVAHLVYPPICRFGRQAFSGRFSLRPTQGLGK